MEEQNTSERRSSSSESRELEKYIKFFSLKALQTIVQARTGCKTKTNCNPSAKGLDWFNIALQGCDANNKLQMKIRDMFGRKTPGLSQPVCVDIVLKTAEGKYTILESWGMYTDQEKTESSTKNNFSVYNRFGILLKSVITISRLLPSYQLSRKVDHDFMLYFKVHSDLYHLHQYELHNIINISSVCTPIGTIKVNVFYRNKIWLSGSMNAHTYVINDTSTLFQLSSDKDFPKASFQSVDMFENEIALAVSDIGTPNSSATSANSSFYARKDNQIDFVDFGLEKVESSTKLETFETNYIAAAFAEPSCIDLPDLELPDLSNPPPFLSLLKDSDSKCVSEDKKAEGAVNETSNFVKNKSSSKDILRQAEAVGFEDDFVLVELRPAFSSDDDSVGNLYKQCKYPVPLDMFASLEREDREAEPFNIDSEIEKYKTELEEYQNFFVGCE